MAEIRPGEYGPPVLQRHKLESIAAMSDAAPARDPREPRFPVIVKHPTFDDVKANFSAGDYTRFLGVSAFSFPAGYVFGASATAAAAATL